MGFPITIRLYGTDVEPISQTPDKSTIDGYGTTTHPYKEYSVSAIDASLNLEGENRTDLNNYRGSKNQLRATFKLKIDNLQYPATTTNLQTFYGSSLFAKRYHYFWANDYFLQDSGVSSTKCLAVAITDLSIESDYENGAKNIVISLDKMAGE
jgi:hypothetical protein